MKKLFLTKKIIHVLIAWM